MNRRMNRTNILIINMAAACLLLSASCTNRPKDFSAADIEPRLSPELSGVTLPVNIAAPTFMVNEKADNYYVEIGIPGQEPAIAVSVSDIVVFSPPHSREDLS